MRLFLIVLTVFLLASCASRAPAPVVERGAVPRPTVPSAEPASNAPAAPSVAPAASIGPRVHTVQKGETLINVALQYGQDWRDIAAWNNLSDPNRISVGQQLVVSRPEAAAVGSAPTATEQGPSTTRPLAGVALPAERPLDGKPAAQLPTPGPEPRPADKAAAVEPVLPAPTPERVAPPAKPSESVSAPTEPKAPPESGEIDWLWPAKGKVVQSFNGSNKGIDIAGKAGQPVFAAAGGQVIYVGAGIPGYGKFVVIKHNERFLSVYAHANNIAVKDRQQVQRGQKIAEMGVAEADQAKLHFEIRKDAKPVDPSKLLPPDRPS